MIWLGIGRVKCKGLDLELWDSKLGLVVEDNIAG